MLITEQKPLTEVLEYLTGEDKVFLVGCRGCAEGCETGGEEQVRDVRATLETEGKEITGTSLVDFACNASLVRMKLGAHEAKVLEADSLLVLACGVAVQTVAATVDRVVHPGCNTKSLGGRHAEWRDGERCLECGQCVLEYTAGFCPVSRCAKQLFNGPCGGSSQGQCEVSPDTECVWQLIVDRSTRIGRLDRLEMVIPPRDWKGSLLAGPPATQ